MFGSREEYTGLSCPKEIVIGCVCVCKGEKIYRDFINAQVYSHNLAVLDDLLRLVVVLTEICSREIPKGLGAILIHHRWTPVQRNENQTTPTGQWCKNEGYLG